MFYDYDDYERKIFLKPDAHKFLRDNYGLLSKALLAEWVKYLERINHGIPLLAAKIENEEAKHGPLSKYRNEFIKHSQHCFYCNSNLAEGIHVDHFIPWSYIFDDNAWNLVLACPRCNLSKSDSLPKSEYVGYLIERDRKYQTIELMRKSLLQLSRKGKWEDEISSHYKICQEYGFGNWNNI